MNLNKTLFFWFPRASVGTQSGRASVQYLATLISLLATTLARHDCIPTLAREKTLFFLIFFLFITSANSFAGTIEVFSDRNPVGLNESFHLIFKSTDSSVDSPDFSPLETDFEILNQNQSSQIQIINGQQSSTKQWTLTLIAKRTGNLTIPTIYFGQEQTAPTIIRVKEANKNTKNIQDSLFLEVEATPKTPYVQSQVIYTVRLFYAQNLQSASLNEPSFSGGEVLVKKLGKDHNYETQRNGKRFLVIERKYALFPQQSGITTIESLNFQAQVRGNRAPGSVFDNFFNQPSTRIKRLRSKAIKLEVKPIPKTFKGQTWLPANEMILKDSFSEILPEFTVGEPVTRTLTLSAEGLTAGQLPEFMKFRKSTLKQYTDQPTLDEQITYQGLSSVREEKIAIIPSKVGEYTLPAIEIPWWNTQTNQMAIIKLPARSIKVVPAATTIQEQSPPAQTTVPAPVPVISQHADYKGYINDNPHYELLTFIFAFGWIATLIAWWWTMKNSTQNNKPLSQIKENDNQTAIKNLKQACYNNNAQKAKKALLVWGKVHSEIKPALQTEIEKLNQVLYGNHRENWQGIDLWKAFKANQPEKVKKKPSNGDDGLEPLYLSHTNIFG